MSLRARLVAATCVVALVALVVAGVATYVAFGNSQLRQIDDTLQRTHGPIEEIVVRQSLDLQRQIEEAAPGTFVAVLDPDGGTILSIPAREPGHEPLLADLDDVQLPPTNDDGVVDRPHFTSIGSTTSSTDLRLRVSRLEDGRVLVVGLSLHEVAESRGRLIVIEAVVAAAALSIAAVVGWLLVSLGLRPLRRVEQTALVIADGGDLDQRVPGENDSTEVGRLARALNTMLERIRRAFEERDATEQALRQSEARMRQFVADVSHELRTPLSAVSAYAELFERGARDHPEDLERALRGIEVESARMHELVEELLLLAHLDEGRPLGRSRVDLNEIVVGAITAARAVSPDWPILLKVSDVVVVEGDPGRLRQVIDNLIANVRTHTPAGTTTSVRVGAESGKAVLVVSDNGPGMTGEQAAHVFERFFRADPSRSRASGGAGLGMAIVHALVTAHGGTIDLVTAPGRGVTITINLPLATGKPSVEERSDTLHQGT
jgi:two-component system, OmpR family, sensor kinase